MCGSYSHHKYLTGSYGAEVDRNGNWEKTFNTRLSTVHGAEDTFKQDIVSVFCELIGGKTDKQDTRM